MNSVWVSEDYNGELHVQSTEYKAREWLHNEVYSHYGDIDLNRPEFEVTDQLGFISIYYQGFLVGRTERHFVDG